MDVCSALIHIFNPPSDSGVDVFKSVKRSLTAPGRAELKCAKIFDHATLRLSLCLFLHSQILNPVS